MPGVKVFPDPSTWTLMLLGFAGLGYAGFSAGAESECDDRCSLGQLQATPREGPMIAVWLRSSRPDARAPLG